MSGLQEGLPVLTGESDARRLLRSRPAVIAAWVIGWGLVTIVVPAIIPDTYYMRLVTLGAIWAIDALALNFVLGYAGFVNLGQSAFMATGAYVTAVLGMTEHWNPWVSLLAGIVAGGAAGVLVALPAARLGGHYFALVTLAAGEVVQAVAGNWTSVTGGGDGISGIPVLSLGSYAFGDPYTFFYLAAVALAVVALISVGIRHSYLGRSLLAIKDDEPAAKARGVPTTSRKLIAFTCCGAVAGLSGGLYASFNGFIDPSSFTVTQNSILVLSMVLLGGAASTYGVIVAAVALTLLPEYLRFLGDSYLIVYGLLIIVVILFLRGGLVSIPARARDGITGLRQSRAPLPAATSSARAEVNDGVR
ncbi:MAG TPA: branched-chain amino acid ABC transporter permease [Trebonia sp.]|jgi:branched-chain amino acid transport system permease protein